MPPTLRVAIVDTAESSARTARLLDAHARARGLRLSVRRFCDGRELLCSYRAQDDVLFLDADDPASGGVDTARRVRRLDKAVQIVFTAQSAARAIEGYAVGALDYLITPVPSPVLDATLAHVAELARGLESRTVSLPHGRGSIRIETDAITYVESVSRGVVVHTLDGDHRVARPLSTLEAMLPARGFYRCHQGRVVNLRHVVRVASLRCDVVDGAVIPISRPRRRAFVQALQDRYRLVHDRSADEPPPHAPEA
ncbi:LytR/AlgR family response regulator transcription factor [Cellulomonas endometrii]|uniref:LytR/AlgR family response regulator transcription factor n=1 Tax=Cellulomonas endometrii TaxID=3036301 RepID=UPI0024AD6ED6|nr:LytTR family DNA-binding domain-containing protein [Cellulomonas endometrii]